MLDQPQLVLRFPRPSDPARPDLLPHAGQDEARAWLDGTQPWPYRRLALYGRPGAGKSHLARHWARRVEAEILDHAPATAWPRTALVVDAIDDVPDEPALLHLLNAAAENQQPVLLVSRLPPGRLPVRLPDLASRLRATTAVKHRTRRTTPSSSILLGHLLADRQLRVPARPPFLAAHPPPPQPRRLARCRHHASTPPAMAS